jgi:hypothetical protein
VCLWNACLELVEGAHLEVGYIRVAPSELCGHAIGGVGKADGEFVPRGKHALKSQIVATAEVPLSMQQKAAEGHHLAAAGSSARRTKAARGTTLGHRGS